MSRRIAWIALALVMVCFVGIAFAAAVKVALKPFDPDGAGPLLPVDNDASGHAILNWAKGANKTEIQVNCWDLDNNSGYQVFLGPLPGTALGTFTTDDNGTGHLHARLPGNQSTALPVSVKTDPGGVIVLIGP